MTATVATATSPICIKGAAQHHTLTKGDLLVAWREWRAAVRAHAIALRDAGDLTDALGLGLGTFTRVARTRTAWTRAVTAHRATLSLAA